MYLPLTLLYLLTHLICTRAQVYLIFNNENVESGETATFICEVQGDPGYTINYVVISDPQNRKLELFPLEHLYAASVVNTTYSDGGVYTCTVTLVDDTLGSTTTVNNTALLIVYVPARVLEGPQSGIYIVGVSFSIPCRSEGFPIPLITWLRDGVELSDDSNISNVTNTSFVSSYLYFSDPIESQSGNYSCRADNMFTLDDNDFVFSDLSTLASIQICITLVTQLEDRNVTLYNPVTILCIASGKLPLSFSWLNLTLAMTSLTTSSELTIENFDISSQLTIHSANRENTGFYQCTVSNNEGNSSAQMLLLVQEKPFPPDSLTTAIAARYVIISWNVSFNGNSPITQNVIEIEQGGTYMRIGTSPGDATQHNVTGLSPFTEYNIRVKAQNTFGFGEPSSSVLIKTSQDKPDTAPRNVSLSAITVDSVLLSWLPPLTEGWNGLITSFRIQHTLLLTPGEGSNIVNSVKSTLTDSLTIQQVNSVFSSQVQELEAYQNYSLRVSACTITGCGLFSAAVEALTLESVPTLGPTIFNTLPTARSIYLQWNEIPLRYRNGVISSYTVLYYSPDGSNHTERTNTNALEHTITTLYPYTLYRVSLAAETTGIGPFGTVTQVLTSEDIPSEPRSVEVTYLASYSELSVSWIPPLTPNGIIIRYTLYYTQYIPQEVTRYNTTTNSPYIIHGIEVGYSVFLSVTAHTLSGESPASQQIEIAPAMSPSSNTLDNINYTQVYVGRTLLLACLIEGTPTPEYRWTSNYTGSSFLALPQTEQVLEITDVTAEYDGAFQCTASNIFGSDTFIFIVSVVESPSVTLAYGFPEFCIRSGDVIHCQQGKSLSLSCSYTHGTPTPLLNFTREGNTLDDLHKVANYLRRDIMQLSDDNCRLYVCEGINRVGSDREELFINLVGIFSIEVDGQSVVSWSLSNTGYLGGYFVIQFGIENVTENSLNISSSSPFSLTQLITVPGTYQWRLKFVTQYADAVVSTNYPFYLAVPQENTILNWLIALLIFLAVVVIIVLILVIVCLAYTIKQRRKRDSKGSLLRVPRPIPRSIPLEDFGKVTTSGFGSAEPVTRDTHRFGKPRSRDKKNRVSGDSFKRPEEYTKNEAYRGPLAFHNRGLDKDAAYKQKPSNFQAASNLKFLGQKSSRNKEPVGSIGFKRISTPPDFPLPPPPIGYVAYRRDCDREINFTPPPPPIPDATYKM